ncbi:MAG: substrate-binding domain-containing protein [Caldilineales bacterium]|nr:substrate-binding domain-containing protein [Caldilineales bacterium]
MPGRYIAILFLLVALISSCSPPATPPEPTEIPPRAGTRNELVLASGTTAYDTGLLDAILPDFERKTGVIVRVLAVGTGQALALGKAGDADVLLVHSRPDEDRFVADGFAPARYDVMVSDFVIAGPADDPADVRGAESAADALARIAKAQATFVSRGDESGTDIKEHELWQLADIQPSGGWYQSAGQGMGAVLSMSDEQQAYTLSDRGTFLVQQGEGLSLEILFEGDPILQNPYGVLPVSPDKEEDINYGAAVAFVNWITSPETQAMIGQFGVEQYGQPLFFPNAAQNK